MTPDQFITKWRNAELTERAAAQSHFIDLCRLIDEPTPSDADPKGEWYAFEKGATKTTGGEGWADVWKRGHFGWEYKGKRKDLNAAFAQLQQYALALENPPILVVSDMNQFRVHTNWTNTVSHTHEFTLEDLRDAKVREKLKWVFTDPEQLRPGQTRQTLTEEAAAQFAALAQKLRARGHEPATVAHFVNRLVFCMFAEDAELLPNRMFLRMLQAAQSEPAQFRHHASTLFTAMKDGGLVGFEQIEWFNGGLFDDGASLDLQKEEIEICLRAADLDWSEIDPSIFGTLFVRGLDPDKRSETGSEYTDREKIMMIVEPVITRPLLGEWERLKAQIIGYLEPAKRSVEEAIESASSFPELQEEVRAVRSHLSARPQLELFEELPKQRRVRALDKVRSALRAADKALLDAKDRAEAELKSFQAKLRSFRVLDPACGSGNFLYIALVELKNVERRVAVEAELLGFPPSFPSIGPEALFGIEINPYAAELARVSVWIGEIQWMRRNGFNVGRKPILKPLQNIRRANAIIDEEGQHAIWPAADVIVGNPPYLGAKLMKRRLGVQETNDIRALYADRLPAFTDLVCYWFERSRELIEQGLVKRAGLVATNSIRKNTNLPVLQRIVSTTRIFEAWNEEQWTVDGAAVDVSLICFGDAGELETRLNGQIVGSINPDLTTGLNLTLAKALPENRGGAFLGIQKSGPFDVSGDVARKWMAAPTNPNGRSNFEVLKPYWNGDDVAGRPRDMWFIDWPPGCSQKEAALYELPFVHLSTTADQDGKRLEVLRKESGSSSESYPWWQPWRPRPEMRSRIERLRRYIVTPETAQYRLFVWLSFPVLPDKNLIVIPREDDLMFGLLHSRFHELWALRKGSDLEDRPRYTHTSTFATFPFPKGMTPDIPAEVAAKHPAAGRIEAAARRLNELRVGWLNPNNRVLRTPEVVSGFPDRLLPNGEEAASELSSRTLTSLYNDPPAWLVSAHAELNEAVAAAYGWNADISDDEAVAKLFALNQERANKS